MMIFRVVTVWLVILLLAVLNGGLREAVLVPQLGAVPANLVSGLLLCGAILLVTWFSLPWLGRRRPAEWIAVGLAWLCLTLVFEFSLGLAQGHSWSRMLAPYRFHEGNLWPLVLVVTAVAPRVVGRLRGLVD